MILRGLPSGLVAVHELASQKIEISPYNPASYGDKTPYRDVCYLWGCRRRVTSLLPGVADSGGFVTKFTKDRQNPAVFCLSGRPFQSVEVWRTLV